MFLLLLAIVGTLFCCMVDKTSAITDKAKVLEQELVEDLVKYAKEMGDLAVTKTKEQRKHFFETGIDKHNKGNSARQLHQLKMSSPKTRAKEEEATRSLAAAKELTKITGFNLAEILEAEDIMFEWKKNFPCTTVLNPSMCESTSQKYRTEDGQCNNLQHPSWGAAGTAQKRYLPANYSDGISAPRNMSSRNDSALPSPRTISNILFANTSKERKDNEMSLMVMAWGQFLDHDITLTPTAAGEEGSQIDCCDGTDGSGRYGTKWEPTREDCFTIDIPTNDPHFNTPCMNFVRSSAALDSCDPGMRQQINAITAFIDGSILYGSSFEEVQSLRSFTKGMLLSSPGNLPPPGSNDSCIISQPGDFCIKTGDVRANVVPHLGANHVLFFREHNRIASELSTLNPGWSDEKTFRVTRKIVSALLQQITYYEWLPSLLPEDLLTSYNLSRQTGDPYNPNVDPSIKNSFAVAAMRFGHSLVSGFQAFLLHDFLTFEVKRIEETFFRPSMLVGANGNDIPLLARWVCANESMKRDRIFERGIRDLLFLDSDGHSFDLGSLNLQRGRDHGVPSYNDWRQWVGAPRATGFGQLTDHSRKERRLLKQAYQHVDDIDLYAGGISENDLPGGHLGRVFSHILARQFHDLKAGDRFFYERPTKEGFTKDQLDEIRKVKFSKIMCENFGLDLIPENIFKVSISGKKLKSCESLPGMDLAKWFSDDGGSGGGSGGGGGSGDGSGSGSGSGDGSGSGGGSGSGSGNGSESGSGSGSGSGDGSGGGNGSGGGSGSGGGGGNGSKRH